MRERRHRGHVLEQPAEVGVVAVARAGCAPERGAQLHVGQQRVEQRPVAGVVDLRGEVLEEAVELVHVAVGDRQERLNRDVLGAFAALGGPLLLKTRRGGYDGKGQARVSGPDRAREALDQLGGRPAMAETAARFRREVALIAARGRDGLIAFYPLTESHHQDGILRRATAPAAASPALLAEAHRIGAALLVALDYVGVIGVEMFDCEDGRLLVNEFAPRVHNTGHWTLDGCQVDQFEQHIRAIAGWPLGPTAALAQVEMTNLLGDEAGAWAELAAEPQSRLWLYGKGEARPLRKMGHVNRLRPLTP